MSLRAPHEVQAVDAEHAAKVRSALNGLTASGDALQLRAGEVVLELSASVREAVTDLLERIACGDSVVIGSAQALLTTSQAADMIGISHTYLLRLADAGKLPVQYRGTHRRFALADVVKYVDAAAESSADK